MASDFDKQLKGIFNTVRSTINPDYAIPKEKANEPMNVRIQRMKDASAQISTKLKELSSALSAFNTNLNALTEEVQPYIKIESEGNAQETAPTGESQATASPEVKTEPAPTETTAQAETEKPEATPEAPKATDEDKK
tara:strand:- start:1117 stop:1527 length:411 start_codon:yes stop_codon:yes gene_type:complete